VRMWRHEGALSVAAITERVRWQLDGWLTAAARDGRTAATAGIAVLRLIPDEVVPDRGRQLGFWGGRSDRDDRALRAVARLSAMVGRDGVQVAEWQGGRGPADQLVLVPADSVDLVARLDGRPVVPIKVPPWPGQLPTPLPAVVMAEPIPAEVVDARGDMVRVNGRQVVETEPMRIRVDGGVWREVAGWAGPWCLQERWWDHHGHRRRARFQILDDAGRAVVAVLEGGRWWIEAEYE
jgi:protein ImuB